MPQMSGPELAKSIRKARRNTEILYMSSYTDDRVGGDVGLGWRTDLDPEAVLH